MATTIFASDSSSFVSFEPLKAWIAAQELIERETLRPAPLTEEQRMALAVLVPPKLTVTQAMVDGEKDWISLLMRYHSGRKGVHGPPPEFRDEGVNLQWRCYCRLPVEAPDRAFPEPHSPEARLAVFAKKKDAKQHAARLAVMWLIENHYLPPPEGVRAQSAIMWRPPTPGDTGASSTLLALPDLSSLPVATAAAVAAATPSPSPGPRAHFQALPPQPQPQPQPFSQAPQARPRPRPRSRPQSQGSLLPSSPTTASTPLTAASATGEVVSSSIASWKGGYLRPGSAGSVDVASLGTGLGSGMGMGRDFNSSQIDSDSDSEQASFVKKLAHLCRTLGLGLPRYNLKPTAEWGSCLFSGTLDFPDQQQQKQMTAAKMSRLANGSRQPQPAISLPPGVGVVNGVFGKKEAKEKMAEGVLNHLRANMVMPP